MHPIQPSKRRRRELQLGAEILETRELLTGGAGDTFAILPGAVTTAGQPAATKFVLDASNFTIPKRSITLGIDVVADPNATGLTPLITSVQQSNGKVVASTFHSPMDRTLVAKGSVTSGGTSAVLTTIRINPANPTFTVNVSGTNNTTGKFLVGFYLPGDTNGDGVVDMTDIKAIKAAMGAKASNSASKYNFDLDANRDGKITPLDLKIAMKNLGVKTTISPVVSANLDQTTDPQLANRVTTKSSVNFNGVASPGATVTFAENTNQTPAVSTKADSKGDYTITTPLASGSNTFKITTIDAFGQSIQGTIAPVTFTTNTAVTPAMLASLESIAAGKSTTATATTTKA
jgi:Dockerin type I domain